MNDLKEFWNNIIVNKIKANYSKKYDQAFDNGYGRALCEIKEKQGLFFWEDIRTDIVELKMWEQAKKEDWIFNFENVKLYYEQDMSGNQIGLKWKYCVACLGEEKVKELVKELEGCEK